MRSCSSGKRCSDWRTFVLEFEVKSKFLINKLYTNRAKEICRKRIKFFKDFLNRLEKEIKGEI